jgi:hypothetical protein
MSHQHQWQSTEAGTMAALAWYKCADCGVFGYVRNGILQRRPGKTAPRNVKAFRCSKGGCKGEAVERLKGLGPRGAYRWACAAHQTPPLELAASG